MKTINTMNQILMRGFTIIELMMALVIMAILASTAVPIYQDYSVRAKVAEAYGVVSALKLAVEDYYISSGSRFPPCTLAEFADLAATCTRTVGTPIITKYVKSTRIGPQGVIEITLDDAIIKELDQTSQGGVVGNVIRFVPMTRVPTKVGDAVTIYNTVNGVPSGVIAWKCVSGQFSANASVFDEANADMGDAITNTGVRAKFAPGECKT